MIGSTVATEHIRPLNGGSQAHLLRCSDGFDYAVKFPNNPQGPKTLACDLLGTLLALQLGLPVQLPQLIQVPPLLVQDSPSLVIQLPKGRMPCQPGTCLGSRFPCMIDGTPFPMVAAVTDFWQDESIGDIRNAPDCAGVLVFDQWTCNTDARQFLFYRTLKERSWRLSMIDQGNCFNGARWNFPNSPLWGFHHGLVPYTRAERFSVFEPWLDRLERTLDRVTIASAAESVPPQWYGSDTIGWERLLDQLDRRRLQVRDLIWDIIAWLPAGSLSRPSCLGSVGTCVHPMHFVEPGPPRQVAQHSPTPRAPVPSTSGSKRASAER